MRKKFITFLLAFSLTSSMLLTACGNKETDSGGGKTETETEAPVADDQQAESEESDEVTTEEEDAVVDSESEEIEITDPKLTGSTPFTDEDFSEMCEAIKESITAEYLKPNNISTDEFVWPDENSESWEYLTAISNFRMPITINEFDSKCKELESNFESSLENELMQATMHGIITWLNEKGGCDAEFYVTLIMRFAPFNEKLPEEITF